MDRNHVVFPTNICHPDEIVELVKGELATAIQTDMNTDNTDEATTDATSEDIVTAESTSQRSLAIATVRQKRVYHVPEAGTFVVVGSKGDKYTVEMFPQEKCLCPSLGTCYHIIAVRMTLNLDNIDEKRLYNLTQLRKNSRKRPNKKAGKKQDGHRHFSCGNISTVYLSPLEPTTTKVPASGTWYTLFCLTVAIAKER
jgi:hypothetical protein